MIILIHDRQEIEDIRNSISQFIATSIPQPSYLIAVDAKYTMGKKKRFTTVQYTDYYTSSCKTDMGNHTPNKLHGTLSSTSANIQ